MLSLAVRNSKQLYWGVSQGNKFVTLISALVFFSIACKTILGASPSPTLIPRPTRTPKPTASATFTQTPSPKPSHTFSPTPSATPTHTPTLLPTPTLTPTPTLPPPPGTLQKILPDGSTRFVDQDNGYQFVLPPDWLVQNLSAEGYSDLADTIVYIFPGMEQFVQGLVSQAAAGNLRLFASNSSPDYSFGDTPAMLLVSIVEQPGPIILPMFIILEIASQSLEAIIPDLEPLGTERIETSTGVQIGVIRSRMFSPEIGEMIFHKSVLFYNQDVLAIITLFTSDASRIQTELVFDGIVDRLEIIEP